jgi:diacylglycerol kinase
MQKGTDESKQETYAPRVGFSLRSRATSFRYAFSGIAAVIRTQPNAWIHTLASVSVVGLGLLFRVSGLEWCVLILAIALVWMAEAMNTALEFLADAVNPRQHPLVGKAKDAAAGAVLLAAIGAAVVGLIILGPYCLEFFGF